MPRRRAKAAVATGEPPASTLPRKKPGPPPGFKRPTARVTPPSSPPLHDGARPDALRRGTNVDLLAEDELRLYARQIGLTQRDATELTVERLRMNCKARLFDLVEDL